MIKEFSKNYPTVASIELTYKCNLRCLHCYGNYGESNLEMNKEKAIKLLNDLKNLGVRLVELTGGDISVYPYLSEILSEAKRLDFDFIGLLTNGIALDDNIKDIVINNHNKFVIQIDLHSLNDDYLKWFTKKTETLKKIKDNIKMMVDNKVLTRVATIIKKRNLDEMDEIIEWTHKIGANKIALSPVINIGRAKSQDDDLFFDDYTSVKKFMEKLKKYKHKYPEFISLKEDMHDKRNNCGTITTNVIISPLGDIKLCASDETEYQLKSIGNVFKNNIKDIYDNNASYIKELMLLKKPEHEDENCVNCMHKLFCSNCILRAFIKSKEIGDECKWYKKRVSKLIKTKLSI